jgi:phospholipase/lecithinase/hemolysin
MRKEAGTGIAEPIGIIIGAAFSIDPPNRKADRMTHTKNELPEASRTAVARACIFLALAGSGFLSTLQAGTIDAIYAFGDSLSDVGNVYAETSIPGPPIPGSPYVNGQFTNGNVWVQDLALDLGLAPLTPSLLGGSNYAWGTGETGVTSFNTSAPGTDLLGATGQLAQFQAVHATADPNALYAIWIGSNDLNDMLAGAPPAQFGTDIGIVAANIDTAIGDLAGIGAKKFLILTVPDLGDTPAALAEGPIASAGASEVSAAFDTTLVNGAGPIPSLSALAAGESISISVLDTYSLLDSIVADPALYDLSNVTQPCLTGEVDYSGGTPCATPNQYLFWDPLHPTAAADEIVASEALGIVTPEPGSFSLIAIGGFGFFLVWLSLRRCAPRA